MKRAVEHGKVSQGAILSVTLAERDERIALLEGQLGDLRGKLAGRAPSPEGAGEARTSRTNGKAPTTFEDAYAQAKAELGLV